MALTTPFAQNGDKKEIPQSTSDGSVSFDRGFNSLYALPPEEGGLFIDRAQFNQLMYDITSAVIENKQEITNQSNNLTNRINEVNSTLTASINTKANQATTYAKSETYNRTEVNNLLNAKANQANTYTKTEVDTRVNAKANANGVVNLTGNQTIAGVKTFSAIPVCATQPTANNQLANKAYVDSKLGSNIVKTYVNGASWYRVYSDGFCIQGGTTTNQSGNYLAINLLKAYKDTNYTLIVNKEYNNSNWTGSDYLYSHTASSFTYYTYSTAQHKILWVAYGYMR